MESNTIKYITLGFIAAFIAFVWLWPSSKPHHKTEGGAATEQPSQ